MFYTERSSTVKFEEFTVYDDLSLHPLELGKLTLTNWSSRFTLQADQEITVEVLAQTDDVFSWQQQFYGVLLIRLDAQCH